MTWTSTPRTEHPTPYAPPPLHRGTSAWQALRALAVCVVGLFGVALAYCAFIIGVFALASEDDGYLGFGLLCGLVCGAGLAAPVALAGALWRSRPTLWASLPLLLAPALLLAAMAG